MLAGTLALAGSICFYQGLRDNNYAAGVSGAATLGTSFRALQRLFSENLRTQRITASAVNAPPLAKAGGGAPKSKT